MKVYLVDAIGIHSGMRYYMDSFRSILARIENLKVEVLSNYSDSNLSSFLPNFYVGAKPVKIFKLFYGTVKLFLFSALHPKSFFVVESYGTFVDAMLMFAIVRKKRLIIDAHEIIEQGSEGNSLHQKVYSGAYNRTNCVIYHSQRSLDILNVLGYSGELIFVPHFEYSTDAEYNEMNLSENIRGIVDPNRVNLLFFGNITYSKGIDLFINNVRTLSEDVKRKLNVIITGKTLDDAFDQCDTNDEVFSVSIQHLNDDEMKYLYSNADYVLLPYRQTSQSGVLEMAFHYKKPVIASKIPYFIMMLEKFPSFGILTDIDETAMHETLKRVSSDNISFYNDNDLYNYQHRKEMDDFVEQIKQYIAQ